MVHEIQEKSITQKIKEFINQVGLKTISAYVTMAILLIAITITFLMTQKTQDIRQDATNIRNEKVESYLTKLRRHKLTPTVTPIPSITPTFTPTPTTEPIPQTTPTLSPTMQPSPTTSLTPFPTITPTQTLTPTPIPTGQITPTSTPVNISKAGDTNNDGVINIQDLSFVLSNWNKNDTPTADFNHDGKIDIVDLSALLSNWGK